MSHPDDGLLQELLDGELSVADTVIVRGHLASCATCTALLGDLQRTQDEANAIVERLDLDPPLVRRSAPGAQTARWFNPRFMGLAASFLLVAGTAWLLRDAYRTRPEASMGAPSDAVVAQRDTGSSIAESVDALVPRADQATDTAQEAAPVIASNKADAPRRELASRPAEPVIPKALASTPAPATGPGAAGGVLADEALRATRSELPAKDEATAPVTSVADAKARLGAPVLTIQGLSPVVVELLEAAPDSAAGVRLVYLVNGARVTLSQRRVMDPVGHGAAAAPAAPVSVIPRDEMTAKQMARTMPAARAWEVNGMLVTLEGMLPADSLAALARRVH